MISSFSGDIVSLRASAKYSFKTDGLSRPRSTGKPGQCYQRRFDFLPHSLIPLGRDNLPTEGVPIEVAKGWVFSLKYCLLSPFNFTRDLPDV